MEWLPLVQALDPPPGLRDIRLPDPVSWWPPAPGWWLLAVLGLVLGFELMRRLMRRLRSPSRAARRELVGIRGKYADSGDAAQLVITLSAFVRRCVLAGFPRPEVAGLTGDAWLEFLNRTGNTQGFTNGPGEALTSAPYQATATIDAQPLLELVEAWVNRALGPR